MEENYIQSLRKFVGHKPLLTVGTWLLIYNEKREVLMQLRSDFQSWDFPGGVIELSESVEECAKRELKEETNLDLDEVKILDVISGESTYRKYPNGDELYVVSLLCEVTKYHGSLRPNDGESKELKWIPIDQIPENLSPFAAKHIDRARKFLK